MSALLRIITPLLARIRRWIAPPVFEDQIKTHTAALINIFILTLVGLWLVVLALLALLGVGNQVNMLVALGACFVGLAGRELMRRGHVTLAGIICIGVGWAVVTAFLYNLGTVRSIHVAGYLLVAFIAVWVGGFRGGAAVLLSIASILALAYAEGAGLLKQAAVVSPLNLAINATGYLGILFALSLLARANFMRILAQMQAEIARRQDVETMLRDLNATLEQHAAKRTAALQASEERYRLLLALSPDGISVVDNAGRLLACNEQCAHLHGYDHSAEMLGRYAGEFYLPEALASLFGQAAATLQSGRDVARDVEAVVCRRDGARMAVECSVARVPWPDAPSGEAFITSFRDITKRKDLAAELERHQAHLEELVDARTAALQAEIAERTAAQAALQRSKASLTAAERTARMGSWERDLSTGDLDISDGLYAVLGFDSALAPRAAYAAAWQAVHPDDSAAAQAASAALQAGETPVHVTFRLRRPSGEICVLDVTAELVNDAVGRPVRMRATAHDITEQTAVQAALQRSQASLAEAEGLAHLGSWEVDLTAGELHPSDELWISDELRRIYGFGREMNPVTVADIDNVIHPDDRAAVNAARQSAVQSGQNYSIRYRIVLPDGRTRVVFVRGEIQRDGAGRPTHVSGMAQDITDHQRVLDDLGQRILELSSLQSLGHIVSLELSLEAIIQTYLERLVKLAGLDLAQVFLLREGGLYLAGVCTDLTPPLTPVCCFKMGECLCGEAVQTRRPVYAADVDCDPRVTLKHCHAGGVHSLAALPLHSGETIIGALAVGAVALDAFAGRLPFLETVADLVAMRLQNGLLHQEVKARAASLEETVAERTQELKTERDRTRAILETVGEPVAVTDLAGRILFANPATETLTGFSREQLLGQPIWQGWTMQSLGEAWPECERALSAGQLCQQEISALRRDGRAYTVVLTGAPLYTPGTPPERSGAVWAQRDITVLKEAAELKDQFVSNVSHELRTPTSIIILNCDTLVTYGDRLAESQRSQLLQDIHEQAHLLDRLVEDILTVSRIDGGRLPGTLSRVDLAQLAREEVHRQRPLAEKRTQHLGFTGASTVAVLGNAGQLRQVVRNLLDNALKYTPAGGQIACLCEIRPDPTAATADAALSSAEAWAVVEVSDNGIGIDARDLPRVFERFYRVAAEGDVPGTGLGLPIAQELTQLHRGRITVVSTPGQGSTFTVYLPLAAEERSGAQGQRRRSGRRPPPLRARPGVLGRANGVPRPA